MNKADVGPSIGTEISGKAKMHARQRRVADVAAQILTAQQHDSRIGSKKPDRRLCKSKEKYGSQQAVAAGDKDSVPQSLCSTIMFTCTDILRRQCRYRRQTVR